MAMNTLRSYLGSVAIAGFGLAATVSFATAQTPVGVDSFANLCNDANKKLKASDLRDMRTQAVANAGTADEQLRQAQKDVDDAATALIKLGNTHLDRLNAEYNTLASRYAELSDEQRELANATGERRDHLLATQQARLDELRRLNTTIGDLDDVTKRLTDIVTEGGVTGNTTAEKAAAVVGMASDLGVQASLSFVGPGADWAAAKAALTLAESTVAAASTGIGCLDTYLASPGDDSGEPFAMSVPIQVVVVCPPLIVNFFGGKVKDEEWRWTGVRTATIMRDASGYIEIVDPDSPNDIKLGGQSQPGGDFKAGLDAGQGVTFDVEGNISLGADGASIGGSGTGTITAEGETCTLSWTIGL